MSYTVSPWRVTLTCDWPGCAQSVTGDDYQSASDVRREVAAERLLPVPGLPWLCANIALRPGERSRPVDLCAGHARERAALMARAREERIAQTTERREEQEADRAARRLHRRGVRLRNSL